MAEPVILHWFRSDLRLTDLPSLHAVQRAGATVLPVYILDDEPAGEWAPGGAARWWLHHSLAALGEHIGALGGRLQLRRGDSLQQLLALCEASGARRIHCTRRHEPWAAAQEQALHGTLAEHGIELRRYPGALLHEPGTVLTQGGEPFRVFTPFWRACRRNPVAEPLPVAASQWQRMEPGDRLEDWQLLPTRPNWAEGWDGLWRPGEAGAQARLADFLAGPVSDYAEGRDRPGDALTSRLSAHLHHGELSPRQVWFHCEALRAGDPGLDAALAKFQAELGWREFSYHLLHFFPTLPDSPFNPRFEVFPWHDDAALRRRWQRGQTGYPIVDAGMRELWQTGHMHNRVRMVVASFLCKHLLQHWRHGARWFWDTLVDADLASNSCSWQWVAGSGADAAPYFRIFNPVAQGEKFDPEGAYVRRWVPELGQLPKRYVHRPWEAPQAVLDTAGVKLDDNYPRPMVDHRRAREAALDAWASVKAAQASGDAGR
ncbi:MAG: deoxyribodipyrimidine photo-lyase [Halieaceae bacterium]|jgi:deoxyribodipyrimidine photo-lyase|nr:deoxyribodipyrimidine photo-lyase [Halieaceae bacterium]